MKSKISVSVKGTTENNSGMPVSTMNISFDWEYNPVELLKVMNEDGPALFEQVKLLVGNLMMATAANDNDAPPASAKENGDKEFDLQPPPFEAAHASSDEQLDVELTVDDNDNVVVTPKS